MSATPDQSTLDLFRDFLAGFLSMGGALPIEAGTDGLLESGLAKEAGGNLAALLAAMEKLRLGIFPTLDTTAFLTVGAASTQTVALVAGNYGLTSTVDACYRIMPPTGVSAAVWLTSPAKLLIAGQSQIVAIPTGSAIVAITNGGAGVIEYVALM